MSAIYFIKQGKLPFIKIGFSTHIPSRLASLQTSCPYKLEVLGVIYGTQDDERNLHAKFIKYRAEGEWFEETEDLLEFIQANSIRYREYLNDLKNQTSEHNLKQLVESQKKEIENLRTCLEALLESYASTLTNSLSIVNDKDLTNKTPVLIEELRQSYLSLFSNWTHHTTYAFIRNVPEGQLRQKTVDACLKVHFPQTYRVHIQTNE